MLVLANGAFKSGSSWLKAILGHIRTFEEIPEAYRDPSRDDMPWLDRDAIHPLLESGVYRDRDILTKTHLYGKRYRELLLSYEGVRVFDITRDIRDSIVSHYYHFKRIYDVDWDFRTFYWRIGRYKAHQIRLYHQTWVTPHPAIYVSSYERLKTDFATEVRAIGKFLDVHLSDEEIEQIRRATSLRTMQKVRGQDELEEEKRFFRKGAVGDWESHFDEGMLNDIQTIEARGLRLPARILYHLYFTLRPALQRRYRRTLRPLWGG